MNPVTVERKDAGEFTDDRSVNRLATKPSVIQEIPLSMEKSGLRSSSVVASIITTPHPWFCGFVQFPETTAENGTKQHKLLHENLARDRTARWTNILIARKR